HPHDSVTLDKTDYTYMSPHQPFRLGKVQEMNDRRAVVVAICKASAPFQTLPVVYTRYSQAVQFAPRERNLMSVVLARSRADVPVDELCRRIERQTGYAALTGGQFAERTIGYYIRYTGIPVNF